MRSVARREPPAGPEQALGFVDKDDAGGQSTGQAEERLGPGFRLTNVHVVDVRRSNQQKYRE